MNVPIVIAILIVTIITTARVSAHLSTKRAKESEERARQERRRVHLALEAELLAKGPSEVWPNQAPDVALRSLRRLGNVGYLVWLLYCEPAYRDHQGRGEDQYPPDWEWRREFVFLRDRGKCQGKRCNAASRLGANLDCHHIRPIAEFGGGEKGIHALTNLVTLCPTCHASQHPGNTLMDRRAAKSWSRAQRWLQGSSSRKLGRMPRFSSPRQFELPRDMEVQPRSTGQPASPAREPDRTENGRHAKNATEAQARTISRPGGQPSQESGRKDGQQKTRGPRSITEGLAIIDARVRANDNGRRAEDLRKRLKDNPELEELKKKLQAAPSGRGLRNGYKKRIYELQNEIRAACTAEPPAEPDFPGTANAETDAGGPERLPTLYEQQLMESLGLETLNDLTAFLNLPPHPDLKMKPPEQYPAWDDDE